MSQTRLQNSAVIASLWNLRSQFLVDDVRIKKSNLNMKMHLIEVKKADQVKLIYDVREISDLVKTRTVLDLVISNPVYEN